MTGCMAPPFWGECTFLLGVTKTTHVRKRDKIHGLPSRRDGYLATRMLSRRTSIPWSAPPFLIWNILLYTIQDKGETRALSTKFKTQPDDRLNQPYLLPRDCHSPGKVMAARPLSRDRAPISPGDLRLTDCITQQAPGFENRRIFNILEHFL
jgi:hypothetical protein